MKRLLCVLGLAAVLGGCGDKIRERAERGDAEAQYDLALAYYKGEGVAKDLEEAVKWFRKAADQGDALALWALEILESE